MKALAELLEGMDSGNVVPEPEYDCADCSDRGWRWTSSGTMARCPCRLPAKNPRLVRRMLAGAGMAADEITSAFEPWDAAHQEPPRFARYWLEEALAGSAQFRREHRNPWCLGLLGDPGRGKTKTAAVLMRVYVELGGDSPLWVRVPEGFDQVQAERRTERYLGADALERRITEAGLVVFDDFGIEHRYDGSLMESTVAEWLARRHRRARLSVITTNAASLGDIGAPRLESRIAEGVYRVMDALTDYRDQVG